MCIRDSYYDSIEVDINSVTDEDFINSQKRAARISILSGDDVTLPKFNHMFTSNDIAKMICGYMNIEDEANERFANTREFMIKTKLRQESVSYTHLDVYKRQVLTQKQFLLMLYTIKMVSILTYTIFKQ